MTENVWPTPKQSSPADMKPVTILGGWVEEEGGGKVVLEIEGEQFMLTVGICPPWWIPNTWRRVPGAKKAMSDVVMADWKRQHPTEDDEE